MKKCICMLLSLVLLLVLAACKPPVDGPVENPDAPTVEPEPTALPPEQTQTQPPEQAPEDDLNLLIYQGLYELDSEDVHILEVYAYNRFLTLEHSLYENGSLYAFWVEEFWPDEDETFTDLYDPMQGKAQSFSVQTSDTCYDGAPQSISICYNDSGIAIQRGDSEEREYYLYNEALPEPHSNVKTLADRLAEMEPITVGEGPVGRWYFDTVYDYCLMDLAEDGSFFMLNKAQGEPVEVYRGAWGLTEANTVAIVSERLGCSTMPYVTYLEWELTENDTVLDISEPNALLLHRFGGFSYFHTYDPQTPSLLRQSTALSYLQEIYGVEDQYTHTGAEYEGYYFYYLPQFFGDSEAAADLNESIMNLFGEMIDLGFREMVEDKPLSWSSVMWDQYRMGDVLAVVLHAYGEAGEQHLAYYYDTVTDTRLYARDVLAKLGYAEDTYMQALTAATQERFEIYHDFLSPEERDETYENGLAWTLSEDNLNPDRSFVINEFGELLVWVPLETVDGTYWDVVLPFGTVEAGSAG